MKEKIINWLKENWFRLVIIIVLISCVTMLYYSFIYKPNKATKEFKFCINTAQEKMNKLKDATMDLWIDGKVDNAWKSQAYEDIKEIYDSEVKDCLLLK